MKAAGWGGAMAAKLVSYMVDEKVELMDLRSELELAEEMVEMKAQD